MSPKGKSPAGCNRRDSQVNPNLYRTEFSMNATAKPRARKAPAAERPTFEQMMALVLDKAEDSLKRIIEIPREDQEWSDDDEDVDSAMSLALEQILHMREHPPRDLGDFCTRWSRAAAVVNLSCKTFSRQKCHYRWCLEDSRLMFDQLADLVEFVG